MNAAKQLKQRLARPEPLLAPLVLDALMARSAVDAGFEALYLGGGAMGYAKSVLEANLSLSEMCQAGLDVTSAVDVPLILDGAAGFGDPMHVHRTIRMAEAAGFAGIEIEDQLLPKRAHHHIGIEHMVPMALMEAKVREAVIARRSDDFQIIARTNAVRVTDIDDAVRRLAAYKDAGADALLALVRDPQGLRHLAERLPPPLVVLLPAGGLHALDMSMAELGGLGYKLLVDTQTPLLAQQHALTGYYRALHETGAVAPPSGTSWSAIQEDIHRVIDLERMLRVERETVEGG